MKDFIASLKDCYREVSPIKLFNTQIQVYAFLICMILVIIGFLSIMWYFNWNMWFIIPFIATVLFIARTYIIYINKKALRKIGITNSKNLFTEWATYQYKDYRLEIFYNKLKENNLLDGKNDMELIDYYLEILSDENKYDTHTITKFIGATFLLFLIPVWNSFNNYLFNKEELDLSVIGIVFSSLSIIYLVILFISFFKDNLNAGYRRNYYICEMLKKVKVNYLYDRFNMNN